MQCVMQTCSLFQSRLQIAATPIRQPFHFTEETDLPNTCVVGTQRLSTKNTWIQPIDDEAAFNDAPVARVPHVSSGVRVHG